MEVRRDEDDRMARLYKASTEGCLVTLNSLMKEDPLTLSRISVNPFGETPLHISASLGHLSFSKQLVSQKPKLAEELDLLKRSPLHLASAEGHTEIVRALIEVNKDMCLVRDEDGKIPLHYAAMRGRVEVIEKLINAEPKSIHEKLNEGETVLHLCVQYNQLEVLKVLVGSVDDDNNCEFLNSKDQKCGNTILHLAVMLKQIETIKYLLSIPGVKAGATDIVNRSGLTAIDMVEHLPKDLKSFKVQKVILDQDHHHHHHHQVHVHVGGSGLLQRPQKQQKQPATNWSSSQPEMSSSLSSAKASSRSRWKKFKRFMKYSGDETSLRERSSGLMVAATVIATMAFQIAINPPGGVWGEDKKRDGADYHIENNTCLAGTAVLGYPSWSRDRYFSLINYNAWAFLTSVSLILLLISGVPLEYKFCMWLLTMATCLTLTFVTLTFREAVLLLTPNSILVPVDSLLSLCSFSWVFLLVIVALVRTFRFLFFVITKLYKLVRKLIISKRPCSGNQNTLPSLIDDTGSEMCLTYNWTYARYDHQGSL